MSRKSSQTYRNDELKDVFTILVHRIYPAYNVRAWKCNGNLARVNISAGSKKYKAVPVNFTGTEDGYMFKIFLSADDIKELHLTTTEFYRLICDIRNDRPEDINRYMKQYQNDDDDWCF